MICCYVGQVACSAGQTSAVGRDNRAQCACAAGFGGDGAACSECGFGFFKDSSGNTACSACPGNTTTYVLGAWDAAMCTCQAGQVLRDERCFQSDLPTTTEREGGIVSHVFGTLNTSNMLTSRDRGKIGLAIAAAIGVADDEVAVTEFEAGGRRLAVQSAVSFEVRGSRGVPAEELLSRFVGPWVAEVAGASGVGVVAGHPPRVGEELVLCPPRAAVPPGVILYSTDDCKSGRVFCHNLRDRKFCCRLDTPPDTLFN